MKEAINGHTFHIPVMGIGFTIDTPVKVAKYGICSVMSMVDDLIVEKMREKYCAKFDFPFEAISTKIEDYRAKRFTAYFDVVDVIVKKSFEDLKNSIHETGTEVNRYMDLLPDISKVKKGFKELKTTEILELEKEVKKLKKQITIRLDEDTIEYFKTMADDKGLPYQGLINLYLRDCAQTHRDLKLQWQ